MLHPAERLRLAAHWKHTATRCTVEGCESTRRKGWSTCARTDHYALGKSLYGAGRISPIPTPNKRSYP